MKSRLLFDLSRGLMALTILVSIFYSQISLANEIQAQENLESELQTHIYYWAFHGNLNNDPKLLQELVDSTAALSEAVGVGGYKEIKTLMERDVHAQGGPQVLLSLRTAPLLEKAIQLGQYAPANRFLDVLGRFNRELGEVSAAFVDYTKDPRTGLRDDLLVSPDSRMKCLRSCASDFLGLQNNQIFQFMAGVSNRMPSDPRQFTQDRAQLNKVFPNDNRNQASLSASNKSYRELSSDQSNHCVSVCMREVSFEMLKWMVPLAGTGYQIGGGYGAYAGAAAGAAIGSAVGLGVCLNGPECSKTAQKEHQNKVKELELQERELVLRDKELRLKEEKQREQDLVRENAKKEAEKKKQQELEMEAKKKQEEASKKKVDEEKSKEKDREIEKGDWADRQKNKDVKTDSSASCESTKTCDGSMIATVIPEHMREDQSHRPLQDGHGNILGEMDLTSTPTPGRFKEAKNGIAPKSNTFDNKPKDWTPGEKTVLRDGTGKIISIRDMTSTPMPRSN
ncbi:hypothetical protein [Bdellovibrio sp.]|uniref:hypothetical protein n=1 Tax=Bdellovibrio sp. TaxID=28201 RepID=UPI0039E39852